MAIFEFPIAVADEPEAWRKNEGDILSVRPYPWDWGRSEIDAVLIVLISIPDIYFTDGELRAFFREPQYADGEILGYDFRDINYSLDKINRQFFPSKSFVIDLNNHQGDYFGIKPRPVKVAKRRFKIVLNDLLPYGINLNKVRNKKYIYQPFKKASQVVNPFDGLEGRHLLKAKDVDCKTALIDTEVENFIVWNDTNSVVYDKHLSAYVSPSNVRDWINGSLTPIAHKL